MLTFTIKTVFCWRRRMFGVPINGGKSNLLARLEVSGANLAPIGKQEGTSLFLRTQQLTLM